ncbi:hypothetical protein KBD20_03460 [Candidatus Saccharibacteria bacterium]|nr:hypothetical protein [Candidatus Saccharibacteria bacterium]
MNRFQLFIQRLGKKRLLVFVLVIIVVGSGIYLLTRTKPIPVGSTYTVSDTVITNTQQPQMTKSGKAVFFTGSNQAQIVPQNTKVPTTLSLITETPYQNPLESYYDEESKSLLLSVEYTGQDQIFNLPGIKPGIQWLVLQKNKQPLVINSKQNQTLDATISGGIVYGLTVEDSKTYNLYSYSIKTKTTTVLARNILSNSVIGATKNSVVTREPNGTVVIYSNKGKELASSKLAGSVIYDGTTNVFVNINDDIDRKNYKLTVFSGENGKEQESTKIPDRYIYVSGGYVFSINQKSRPESLVVYDQKTLQGTRHPLVLDNTPSEDAITSVVVLETKPFTLGIFGSSNSLQLASDDSKYINSLPEYKYPFFSSDKVGGTLIESYPGSINVVLTTDINNIKQSLDDLKTSCNCDVNQLSKTWVSNKVLSEEFE